MKNIKRTDKGEKYMKEKAGEYKPLEGIDTRDKRIQELNKDVEGLKYYQETKWKEMEEEFIVDMAPYVEDCHEIIEWFKQRTIPK